MEGSDPQGGEGERNDSRVRELNSIQGFVFSLVYS